MKRYYNNGKECHMFEEGCQPDGFVRGKLHYKDINLVNFNDVIEFFKTHTELEVQYEFGINGHQLADICKIKNFTKSYELINITRVRRVNDIYGVDNVFQLQSVIETSMATRVEKHGSIKAAYKNRNNKIAKTLQERTGNPLITNVFQLEEVKQKSIDTLLNKNPGKTIDEIRSEVAMKGQITKENKYGYRGVLQTAEVEHKKRKKYTYDGEQFDSSWELALWIYAKDHNETIVRSPFEIEYTYDNKKHYYHPDFIYNGNLIEIKADWHLDSEGHLTPIFGEDYGLVMAKDKCVRDNNVKLMVYNDIKFAIEYVNKTYGKAYLKSFKNF